MNLLLNSRFASGRYQSGSVTITKAFRSKVFAIAGLAVDFLIGTITSQHRVKRAMTLTAVVTLLVPHSAFRQLLFSSKDGATTTGTTFTLRSLNRSSIRSGKWTISNNLFLTTIIAKSIIL